MIRPLITSRALDRLYHQQHQNGADQCGNDGPDDAAAEGNAQRLEKPSAHHRPDDTENDIAHQPQAGALDQDARESADDAAEHRHDQQTDQQAHACTKLLFHALLLTLRFD